MFWTIDRKTMERRRAPVALAMLVGLAVLGPLGCTCGNGVDPNVQAEDAMQALLQGQFPSGSTVANPDIDDRITVGNAVSTSTEVGAPLAVGNGMQIPVTVNYSSSGDPVTSVCIAFGGNPRYCVPFTDPGVTVVGTAFMGTATVLIQLPAGFCAGLSRICHDIRCFESAQTSIGRVSRANLNEIVSACGACDEPSCQGLADIECDFDCRNGNRIPSGQVCNGSDDCGNGADEAEAVCNSQVACCIATNSCPDETGTSCGLTCCCCPLNEVCDPNPNNGCVPD